MTGFLWGILTTVAIGFLGLSLKNPYGYKKVEKVVWVTLYACFALFNAGLVGFALGASGALGLPLGSSEIDRLLPYPLDAMAFGSFIVLLCGMGLLWLLGELPKFLSDPSKPPKDGT